MLLEGKSPREVLRQALDIIEESDRWDPVTQDAAGFLTRPQSPTAVRWSIEGAIARCCNNYGILPPYFMKLLDEVLVTHFGFEWNVPYFEQHHGHDDVCTLLQLAIERAPG